MPVKFLVQAGEVKTPQKRRGNTSSKAERVGKALGEVFPKPLTEYPDPADIDHIVEAQKQAHRELDAERRQEIVNKETGEITKAKEVLGPVEPDWVKVPFPPLVFDPKKDPVQVIAEYDRIIAHFQKCLDKYPEAYRVYEKCIAAETALKANYIEWRKGIDGN